MASQPNTCTQQNHYADEACVVILGKTGSGKSSIGNLLLREEKFNTEVSMSSQTKECQAETRKSAPGLSPMRVVDTPGTMDTSSRQQAIDELSGAITLSPSGFDAFLLVVRADVHITDEERELFANLVLVFGEELYRFSIVVFTHGDAVREDKRTFIIEQRRHPDNKFIDQLLKDCGERWVMMDARSAKDVNYLQGQINQLRAKNQKNKYTNGLFAQFDQASHQLRVMTKEMLNLQNQKKTENQEMQALKKTEYAPKEVSQLKKEAEEKMEKLQKELDRCKKKIRQRLSDEIRQLCQSKKSAAHGGSSNSCRPQLPSMASQPKTQQNTDADEICVVILGKTGSGKSSIGNLLLGENKFDAKVKDQSLRGKKCMAETRKSAPGQSPMRVVDTPGTIDTSSKDQAIRELSDAITLSPSGFDAFLLVVRVDVQITEEEEKALARLVRVFGKELYRFSIVVFTHGDAAKDKRADITKLMRQVGNEFIHQLLENCVERGAWVMMDARSPREADSLHEKINQLRWENEGEKYRNHLFDQAFHQLREMRREILPLENKITKVQEEMQALEEREQQLGPTNQ